MKAYIESTIWFREGELIERYPELEEFGYGVDSIFEVDAYNLDGRVDKKPYIRIYSLEDLIKLNRIVKQPLIFDKDRDDGGYTIEIYDGYRE